MNASHSAHLFIRAESSTIQPGNSSYFVPTRGCEQRKNRKKADRHYGLHRQRRARVSQIQREEGDHESSNEKSSSACLWISFELRTLVVASCIRFRGLYSICDSDYFSIEHHNRIRYTSIGSCSVL